MHPNGLWYGISIPVSHDEAATKDKPIKRYCFKWVNRRGKRRSTCLQYLDLESAVKAADAHRKAHPDNGGYSVVGRAISMFAF